MNIECPICNRVTDLDGDELPPLACDSNEWECPNCEATMLIGWYGEAEVRGNIQAAES